MKITAIETYLMQVGGRPMSAEEVLHGYADFRGSRNWLFVRVMTDAGIHGVGECSGWPRVVETAVKDLAHVMVGEDPSNIDRLWNRMFLASMGHGVLGTVGAGALSGIEMALWDIKGKALGQPVWNLLGGCYRELIPVYGHAKSPEAALKLVERGYGAIKVSFTGGVDIDKVAAVREAVGPGIDLMVDAHGPTWMTPRDAILLARNLEPLDLLFLEDPIAPDNLDAFERVRDGTSIPLAAGERLATIWGMRPLIERELVDVIQPDTGRAGGITQMRKIAAMAEAHWITVAPHSGSLGPVGEIAALHVMATIPNALMLERMEFDWLGRYQVVTPSIASEDGYLRVPTTPGLGVDIVIDEISKYPSLRNVAALPGDDGWTCEPGTQAEYPYFQTRRSRGVKLKRLG